MSNKFGELFSFTTWGESHGEAIGCVIDGCPSMIDLCEDDIQKHLDRRRPGQSKFTTQRQETDQVKILSGVFEGKTTGTPISLIIYNQDQRSQDYGDIKDKFRPSHADYTYFKKYGIRDYRGGGRSSARETAMRVAAGAVAMKVLEKENIKITGYLKQLGDKKINPGNINYSEINNNDFFCPDAACIKDWENYLLSIRKDGSSVGAVIELVAKNVLAGLGEPIYNKLDARIASALMSINAVKAVEIGNGFDAANLRGEENADEMWMENGQLKFSSNNAGGILGGISSGQDIIASFAVKPTSSILKPRKTIDINGNNTEIITKGRHDPCVGIRAVPVGEAMLACVLLDFLLINRAYKK
ncbi:MAG: chorismate synthase [Rickettsiaceae bacterium]|jgi:chorismate synthase|nr:chorismate synthase [Rickettsiaceae bacterium]